MLSDLNLIVSSLFSYLSQIYSLYIGGGILTAVLVIWLLSRVVSLFHKIR